MVTCNVNKCHKEADENYWDGEFMNYFCKRHLREYKKDPKNVSLAPDVLEARHRRYW